MTISELKFYDAFHVGGIIRSKDYLMNKHNVSINITKKYHGGGNGRTYQQIEFVGALTAINKLKQEITYIENQCELDYLEKKKRDAKRKQFKTKNFKIKPIIQEKKEKKSSNRFEVLNEL